MPTSPSLADVVTRLVRLEAVLFDAPTQPANAIHQTPNQRAGDTPLFVRQPPKREPSEERPRPKPEFTSPSAATAVSPVAVLGSLDDVVWSVSPDGQFVLLAGGAVERLYGLTPHALEAGRGVWLDALPSEDRERLRAALARLPDADTFALEHRIAHPGGTHRWAVSRGKLVRDRDGRPLRVDGITTDVTRKAQAREAVLAVLEACGPTTGGEFLAHLVQGLCAACGWRAAVVAEPHPQAPGDALVAFGWLDGRSADPFAVPARAGLVRDLLAGGRVLVPEGARTRHPSDPLVQRFGAGALAAEPLLDSAGRLFGFLAVADDPAFTPDADPRAVLRALAPRAAVELVRARDDGTRRDLAARLAAAERRASGADAAMRGAAELAGIGRMAAGVAHDFNNLFGVVIGNAELIRESLPPEHPHRETAEAIVRATQTVANVSRKLLTVGKPGPAVLVPMDVCGSVLALEPVLRRLAGNAAPIDLDLAPALPHVRTDPAQFDRVLLNLVLNARDATEAKGAGIGVITVRAALAIVEPGRAGWPKDRAPGRYVTLTVIDNGCGMTADVREQMFRAFFTTKGPRGTGLGLATVAEAVAAAKGHIEVESEVGWGTQVRVYLPALPEAPARTPRVMW